MTEPRVSVVLTTYQRADLAKRALQSVFDQTLAADEIIVVEDAGQTDLAEWLASLGREDLKYVRHETNRGLAAARNTGLRLANGDLIAYLDDDDQWLPNRLQEQVERIQSLASERRHNLGSIQVACKIVDTQGQQVGLGMPRNQGNLRESIQKVGAATPSSCFMFLRSALLDIDGFDEELISGIDHDIWMKLAVAGYSNEIIRKPLVVVTADDRQTMMSDTKRRLMGVAQFVEKWTPTYQDWFGDNAGKIYGRRYFINVACGLAARKFSERQFRDGMIALKAAMRYARWRPGLLAFAAGRLLRTYASYAAPQLRAVKRFLVRQHDT